jgi:hypothetical protein
MLRARLLRLVVLLAVVAATALVGLGSSRSARAADVTTLTGTLPDGATWLAEVPAQWNGTLLLYSHGYRQPGSGNPASDAGDPVTGGALLSRGFALAGSSYAHTGWAVQEGLADQLATLDAVSARIGAPRQTVAWGHSLGGMITAGLVQLAPRRFAGALPMCGVLGGSVGTWNIGLDGIFAFKTLLAPGSALPLVHITDPLGSLQAGLQVLAAAQATPQGRARLALVAALGDLPGWADPTQPEPAPDDVATRQANQFGILQQIGLPFAWVGRAEVEARAGGNPSWNTGVDYARQLRRSADRREVQALYAAAGLDLRSDLAALAREPRIAADPAAVDYLTRNVTFDGDLGGVPTLTIHTTDDTLVGVQNEQAYAAVVRRAGDARLLRQAFVHRAGHCSFTPAETIAALQALLDRVAAGDWHGGSAPAALDAGAAALGPGLNVLLGHGAPIPTEPAYAAFRPGPFLRPFDLGPDRAAAAAAVG